MSAIISECGLYRYRLERALWADGFGSVVVIMANPSTADGTQDDPTITRLCRRFMKNEYLGRGFRPAKLIVGNLFAFRSTDIGRLATAPDPIGPDNDDYLRGMLAGAQTCVYAWGPMAKFPVGLRRRWLDVHRIAVGLDLMPLSIGLPALDGHPRHPLMLPYEAPLYVWPPAV